MNSFAKKSVSLLAFAVCALILGGALLVSQPPAAEAAPETAAGSATAAAVRTIAVSGEGRVYAEPDIATLSVGVNTDAKTAKEAQTQNAAAMTKVLDALAKQGIEKKHIQTSDYSISTRYDYSGNTERFIGYTVSNMVNVTVRDITKLGAVLDAVTENGANRVYGVSFGVSDQQKYYKEALKLAIAAAEDKAKAMAEPVGAKLGKPVALTEEGSGYQAYNYRGTMAMDAAAGVSTPIETGQLAIVATVSAVYEY